MNEAPIETSESLYLGVVVVAFDQGGTSRRGLGRFRSCWNSLEGAAIAGAAAGQLEARRGDFGPRVGEFAALEIVDSSMP